MSRCHKEAGTSALLRQLVMIMTVLHIVSRERM